MNTIFFSQGNSQLQCNSVGKDKLHRACKKEGKQNESISAPYCGDIAIQGHSGVILLQQAENASFRE